MPNPALGIAGIGAVTSIGGGLIQSSAAKKAARAQTQAADASIAEQRRQFDALQSLLRPYANAGTPALQGLMDLAGLSPVQTNWSAYAQSNPELMAAYEAQRNQPTGISGLQAFGVPYYGQDMMLGGNRFQPPGRQLGYGGDFGQLYGEGATGGVGYGQPLTLDQFAQQWAQQKGADVSQFQTNPQAAAVARIEGQPMFQALARQGEDAILQNASATGGLRGGNTQGALARFRPQLLNQFIEQQYGRLAGITALGQQSAAGVGTAGLQTGTNIANILQNAGAAQAAGYGAQGQIWANTLGGLGGSLAGFIRPAAPQASLVGSVNGAMAQNPGLF